MAARRHIGFDVSPDVALTGPRGRRGGTREVCVVGELAASVRAELSRRGAAVTDVTELADAFGVLANQPFDVVVVNPLIAGGGVDFVNAIKEGASEHEHTVATLYGARGNSPFLRGVRPPPPEVLDEARVLHATTPFILLPVDERPVYAIIVRPREGSWVKAMNVLPLETAIMTVTALQLLTSTHALA